mgnify:CR=1 FL=1
MLEKFYPGEYLDSTYVIDFDRLYEEGYRGVIFDIDNTLVPHGAPADERACALFAHLKELGFQCMLLSNNKEPRVKMFNDAVHVSYIYKAGKPKPGNYRRAMQDGEAWHRYEKHSVCRRSDIYGCLRCQSCRDQNYSGETDPSERGDPDRIKTVSGKNCFIFLCQIPEEAKQVNNGIRPYR